MVYVGGGGGGVSLVIHRSMTFWVRLETSTGIRLG